MKQFDSLCDTFNIDGVDENTIKASLDTPNLAPVPEAEEDDEDTEDENAEVSFKGQKYTLKSFKYMKALLQEKIHTDTGVLEKMEEMCKVGANARLFEVYATLSNTIASHIRQLQDMEKVMTDYRVIEEKEKLQRESMAQKEHMLQIKAEQGSGGNTYNIQNNTQISLTSSELEAMIEKADADKKINTEQISTEFNLE